MVDSGIKDKKIVIWGIGILQSDLDGIFGFPNLPDFLYYVDDCIQEKNLISVSKDLVYPTQKLAEEIPDQVLVIICQENHGEAITRLKSMGYGEDSYILGEELLVCNPLCQKIRDKDISVWGMGTMYLLHETEINRHFPNVARFIVTEKENDSFRGKEVISLEDGIPQDSFVIVSSIYYKEIYKNLIDMGKLPGEDFLHVETLMAMCSLSLGIDETCQFTDCRKGSEYLLIVLAGYKEFVWESVFGRLRAFVPKDIDICIVTSGLVNSGLQDMCEEYQWSYLSTSRNNVSMAVNTAIWKHSDAQYVYKMDEDIFLTKGVFEILKDTYQAVSEKGRYEVGFVTPLIPINGYGHVRLLEIFDAVDLWQERFGELKYTNLTHHRNICENPETARFMWGEGNQAMNDLDRMQQILSHREFQYSICPIRYSIGFVLFHRNSWIRMKGFPAFAGNMGMDEEAFCQFCVLQSYAMVVAENAVVGHLAFGPQNKAMEQYYHDNRERFMLLSGGR
jgi:hypothetical protein